MKYIFRIFVLLLFSMLFVTCKQDDNQPTYDSAFGSIFVKVKADGVLVPNANVVTNPQTDIYETDLSGTVIVKDIEPDTYQVTAFHPDYGNGIGAAIVNVGYVTSVEIDLLAGNVPSPNISFISPENGETLDIDTDVVFTITVSDDMDDPQNISLEWTSSIVGLLSTQAAGANGTASITVSDLAEGEHRIQVKATDSDGLIGVAIIDVLVQDIPNSVFLNPLQTLSAGIQLNWTTSDDADFSNYKVYRSTANDTNFELIEIINDINTTTFVDNNVSVGQNYFYQIGLNVSSGDERISNTQSLAFEGISIYVGTQIEKMIVDPNRPFIYAVDRVNNSLLFIDTDEGVLTKTIFVGSSPVDLDISLDGEKLYIANFGSTQINVVNLNTQQIQFSFFVETDIGTWDGNPYRIAILSNNRLAFTGEDQWNNITVVNATTGNHIAISTSNIFQPNIFANSTGTILYAGESSISTCILFRYPLIGNSIGSNASNSVSGSFPRNSFITHNDEFIFFAKQKLLASNIQSSLGTFSDHIYAANADGSIALGEEQYYDGNTFAIIGNLPVSSTVMAFDPNEELFYIYNTTSSSIVVFNP